MKIGDKVRFLSETGGGIIAGFQKNNIVLVEDEDGFQIPTPISQIVPDQQDQYQINYQTKKTTPKTTEEKNQSVKSLLNNDLDDSEETESFATDPSDKPVTFVMPTVERKGANLIAAYLAFIPTNPTDFSISNFEMYMVNDCNYDIFHTLAQSQNQMNTLLSKGEVPANTKVFIKEIQKSELNDIERLHLQIITYKTQKFYTTKPVYQLQIRLNLINLFKHHLYNMNDYFETPALLHTLICDDVINEEYEDTQEKLENLFKQKYNVQEKSQSSKTNNHSPQRKKQEDIIVTDLHVHELLEATAGMSNTDILQYQVSYCSRIIEENLKFKGKKLIFIHGKGEGVLRKAVIEMVRHKYKNCNIQDASFREYGYGATQVTIK